VKKIVIAFILVVIIACAAKRNQVVKFQIIKMEEKIPLVSDDPDSICYHVELNFTELTDYHDKKVLEKVKKELNRQFFEIKKNDCSSDPLINFKLMLIDLTQNYRTEGRELKNEYGEMNYMLNYELIKNTKVVYNKNEVLIVELETYVYSGGAHGIGNQSYLHFNMKTGEVYNLAVIFKPGYKNELNKIIQARCDEKKQSDDFFVFNDARPTVNENFYFDNKNFYFVYNPYEIAPYSSGYITIDIPIEKIENWIDKKGPLAFVF
jgi:hypothetical protein